MPAFGWRVGAHGPEPLTSRAAGLRYVGRGQPKESNVITSLVFAASLADAAPFLDISGQCPDDTTITITGATPFGTIQLFRGEGSGAKAIPAGACAGVVTGLSGTKFKMTALVADAAGTVVVTPALKGLACEFWLQAVDEATCELSAAEPLARLDEEWVLGDYADFGPFWDSDTTYNNSVDCPATCASIGLSAVGARFVCNAQTLTTEGCSKDNDFAYGTANCGWMVRDGVALTENGNSEDCASYGGIPITGCVTGACSEPVTYHAIQCQCK